MNSWSRSSPRLSSASPRPTSCSSVTASCPHIERRVTDLNLSDRVIFLGIRSDVPRLMQGAMDAFLFPSFYEGLPVALIEAQAAGLPLIISDVITEEVDIVTPLVRRLSLSQPVSSWAESVLTCFHGDCRHNRQEALSCIKNSKFDIAVGVTELAHRYLTLIF